MNNLTTNTKYIYLIFSSTVLKMGRVIRYLTHNKYNHVAFSLDDKLEIMYSFARHYENTPFYGGFVEETSARYIKQNRLARIKICRISVTNDKYQQLERFVEFIKNEEKSYIYNGFSAIASIFHKRVHVYHAWTCLDFALEILHIIGIVNIKEKEEIFSIKQLEKRLSGYVTYEGSFYNSLYYKNDDVYFKSISFSKNFTLTLMNYMKLIHRYFGHSNK